MRNTKDSAARYRDARPLLFERIDRHGPSADRSPSRPGFGLVISFRTTCWADADGVPGTRCPSTSTRAVHLVSGPWRAPRRSSSEPSRTRNARPRRRRSRAPGMRRGGRRSSTASTVSVSVSPRRRASRPGRAGSRSPTATGGPSGTSGPRGPGGFVRSSGTGRRRSCWPRTARRSRATATTCRGRAAERGAEVVPERRLVVDDRRLLPRPAFKPDLDELIGEVVERPAPWLAHPLLDLGEASAKRPLRLPAVPLGLAPERLLHLTTVRVDVLHLPRRRHGPSYRITAAPLGIAYDGFRMGCRAHGATLLSAQRPPSNAIPPRARWACASWQLLGRLRAESRTLRNVPRWVDGGKPSPT